MAQFDDAFILRFWSKVNKTDSCWIWTASKNCHGYGQIHQSDRSLPREKNGRTGRKMLLAHRVSWLIANGDIPDGLDLLHNCPGGDNPSCVNPAHLRTGTHSENIQDAYNKGQMKRGEGRPAAKLTDDNVREIRRRHAAGGITQCSLANEFGVSFSQICGIVNNKTWTHVK